jgi:trimethylamine-N-oxide reductase (cytochrome c)
MMPGNFTPVAKDVSLNTEMIVFQAGDWECNQNHNSQFWSHLLAWYKSLGIKMVFVDPICNYTAVVHADKWIPIKANTDVALDFAIMYTWLKEDTYDKEYMSTHTVGSEKFFPYLMGDEDGIPKTPAWASEITGIPEYTIKALAREWAAKITGVAHFCGSHIRGPYSHEPGRTEVFKFAMQGIGKPGVTQLHLHNQDQAAAVVGSFWPISMGYSYRPCVQNIPRTRVADAILEGHWKVGVVDKSPALH